MSTAPLDVYAAWFEGLAPELARTLAQALMQQFPGDLLTPTLMVADPTDGLLPRIRRLASTPLKALGLAATLATLTDLILMERSEGEVTAQTGAMLEVLDSAQKLTLTGDGDSMDEALAQWVAEQKLRHPLLAKQWSKAEETWRPLREGPLALDALIRHKRARMLGL
jgi:hypothetical protein